MTTDVLEVAPGRLAIYEQRKASRTLEFDAYVETTKGNKAKISYRDADGRIHSAWVAQRLLRIVGDRV